MPSRDFARRRRRMVEEQIAARGVRDARVLRAMEEVPRELFVGADMAEFAFEDSPLPIGGGQTISQPYIVARMAEALMLPAGARVLEVGTGSGYGAAVLGRLAAEVFTIERLPELAARAQDVLARAGADNVQVRVGDGTLGWPEAAPFDGILVTAGGPAIPDALLQQLKVGGALIIPVGDRPRLQTLLRVVRSSETAYRQEDLGAVRFVPLVGAGGWPDEAPKEAAAADLPSRLRRKVQPFAAIDTVDLGPLLDRIGEARVVLLGEASHGTAEFYEMRARITRELIERRGFRIVAVEADWPDAARLDAYVRHQPARGSGKIFGRFPTWMWANEPVLAFLRWLRDFNAAQEAAARVGVYGLDLYSLYSSMEVVLDYLERIDPATARVARQRYGCLSPWEGDPATYGAAKLTGKYRQCEQEVVAMLREILCRQAEYTERDGWRFLDVAQNARLIANAERYYRIMYYGGRESWNLRDRHMFETLEAVLDFHGPQARAVVWEHNSHIGDAAATEMGARGEINVGRLCREKYGGDAYLIGFGTDHGTVAAADDWDEPMQVMEVLAAHPASYERLCHETGIERFFLPLRAPAGDQIRDELLPPRLERAIGVVYRPRTELQSHYFQAVLPKQFDEYIWFDRSRAVRPLVRGGGAGAADTFPFGL